MEPNSPFSSNANLLDHPTENGMKRNFPFRISVLCRLHLNEAMSALHPAEDGRLL